MEAPIIKNMIEKRPNRGILLNRLKLEFTDKGELKMRKTVATDKAPAAIGPYAQANVIGNLVFT